MSTNSPCPETDRLEALLAGNLPAAEQASLEAHLKTCETCRARLDELTGQVGLLSDSGRREVSEGQGRDTALRGAMNRLKAAGPSSEADSADMPTAAEEPGVEGISLDFLDPPTQAHCLGQLGTYEITGVVGHGGMGVVLKGRDPALNRYVAIKVLSSQLASNAVAGNRFMREAQMAAAVSHDHVVTIHAVAKAKGLPFLVMEYVAGVSLEERLRRSGPLRVEEILRIGMQTAAGLAAAHAQGLVHRDIKPSNILLENGVERVKITDFGLARVVHEAKVTQTGVVAGTPEYMSPEQAKGEEIDRRSDLFSLGCVLYAMCTGRSPFRASTVTGAIHRVCEDTPRPIREVNPDIPDWLTAIIDRLLAKKPDERFQTAEEVANILGAYLAHIQQAAPTYRPFLPVASKPNAHRRREMTWKVVLAIVVGVVILASFVVVNTPQFRRHGHIQTTDTAVPPASLRIGDTGVTENSAECDPTEGGELLVDVVAPGSTVELSCEGRSWTTSKLGGGQRSFLRPGQYQVEMTSKGGDSLRNGYVSIVRGGIAHLRFHNRSLISPFEAQPSCKNELLGPGGGLQSVVFFHHGDRLAATGENGRVEIWTLHGERQPTRQCLNGHKGCMFHAALSPDDAVLATAGADGSIRLWEVATGQPLATLSAHAGGALQVAFSPDGKIFVSSGSDRTVRVWDCQSRRDMASLVGHEGDVDRLEFSPDGKSLASGGSTDRTVRVWDVASWNERCVLRGHSDRVGAVAFAPDNSMLASSGWDGMVRLWDPDTGRLIRSFEAIDGPCCGMTFSRDAKSLAVSSGQTVKRWELEGGDIVNDFHAHWHSIPGIALSPDASTLATASLDGSVRLWDLSRVQHGFRRTSPLVPKAVLCFPFDRFETAFPNTSLAFSPLGDKIATAHSYGGFVRVWDTATTALLAAFKTGDSGHNILFCSSLFFVGDATIVASLSREAELRVYDTILYGCRASMPIAARNANMAASCDGNHIVTTHSDHKVCWRDVEGGDAIWSYRTSDVLFVPAVSPDGSTVAVGTQRGDVLLLNTSSGRASSAPLRHGDEKVYVVSFSPDGKTLASAGAGKVIKLWDIDTRRVVATVQGNCEMVHSATFSPDGRFLVTGGGWDFSNSFSFPKTSEAKTMLGEVILWDVVKQRIAARFHSHTNQVCASVFSPDGKTLATTGGDARVRLWDVEELIEQAKAFANSDDGGESATPAVVTK